jgi:D-glycero-D-manno-heptose 1,7-bisphosphate phosphatase
VKKRALFLDRDGVINVDHGYVFRIDDFHFVEGIFELVAEARRLDFLVVVVTNQAGIGRGYYSEADFHQLMTWVCEQFELHGTAIDGVYFCPDHPEHGVGNYRRDSEYRKPRPGMLLRAAEEMGIDLKRSVMVGDKATDMEAARAAGVPVRLCFCSASVVTVDSCGGIVINSLAEALSILRHIER